ncbi:MAG TPA: hypothetical protein PLM07_12900 [Candidatus Rifleibacterium sp.]|nr:hypothetical protein [Candidatus Rifleibacterium sp.]HPT46782.1 hypothetical protein [Candidatus Rifleibacterium sp.]
MPVTRFVLFPNVTIVFAAIILFFAILLGWIIVKDILGPIFMPSENTAEKPAIKQVKLLPLFLTISILWGPFLLGLWWVWPKPAFFRIEQNTWVVRNSFWYTLQRIAPEAPRQIEFCLTRSLDDMDNEEEYFVGDIYLYDPAVPDVSMKIGVSSISENASGSPVIFEELGYLDTSSFQTGQHKGLLSPLHTWTASGPDYRIAEQPK